MLARPDWSRSMHNPDKLKEMVNRSGFPLQIGLAHHVQRTSGHHGWQVLYQEHAWRNKPESTNGFVDLVLADNSGSMILVIECKRVLDSSWIFLLPNKETGGRRRAKAWVSRYNGSNFKYFDWKDVTLEPTTPESSYCIVPGQDAKSKPMLERIAAEVIFATEALAAEDQPFVMRRGDSVRIYFNVIVTTAALKLCYMDPSNVRVEHGTMTDGEISDGTCVRFRKQMSTRALTWPQSSISTDILVNAKENTVFVVNSEHFVDFLSEFEVDKIRI